MTRFVPMQVLVLAAAAMLLGGQMRALPSLQRIADEAALAAVQALAVNGQPADAADAAKQTLATIPNVSAEVNANPADLVVTVKLSAADAKAKPAVSTARFVHPDQPAAFAWAQRQRFAIQPSPVVLGDNCGRDCGTDRSR